jgi:transcriptional regulator with XRE-family HTH domain
VKLLFTEMRRRGITYDDLVFVSGVQRAAIKAWRHKNRPSFENLTAVANALGIDVVFVPRAGVLPADLEDELQALADRFERTVPELYRASLAVMARQQINPAERGPMQRWEP